MDLVFIDRLDIATVIGIHDFEQQGPQPLLLSVEVAFDNRAPAASGRVEDTLDYSAMASRLRALAQGQRWRLIETLAEASADLLRDEFGARWLRLRIDKPEAVTEADSVGVIIEREFGGGCRPE